MDIPPMLPMEEVEVATAAVPVVLVGIAMDIVIDIAVVELIGMSVTVDEGGTPQNLVLKAGRQ